MTNEIEQRTQTQKKKLMLSTDSEPVFIFDAHDQIRSHSQNAPPADRFLNQMGGPYQFTCFCLHCPICHKRINISWFNFFSVYPLDHNNCNKTWLFGNREHKIKRKKTMTFGFSYDSFGFHQTWWRSMIKSTEPSINSISLFCIIKKTWHKKE